MAVVLVVRDAIAWWADGAFHFAGLGELWSRWHLASFAAVQTAVQRYLSANLWAWIARPVLAVPALIPFLAVGVLLLWLGWHRPSDESLVLSASRPRRRRSRSTLS